MGRFGPLDYFFIRYVFAFLMYFLTGLGYNYGAIFGPPPDAEPNIYGGFQMRTVEINGELRRYQIYVPPGYDPSQPTPLIYYLSGASERGSDGVLQTKVGIGPHVEARPDYYHCLVMFPQCPMNLDWIQAPEYHERVFEDVNRLYNVDPDRMYLTGTSMGADATWVYGAEHADKFAALMPLAGHPNPDPNAVESLATLPIRIYHSQTDLFIPVGDVRAAVQAIEDAGGDVNYTEIDVSIHNVWDQAYGNPEVIQWLLSKRLSQR